MNYEVLIAVIIGMPEEEMIGYYDEEDCQCCYDYVSHTDPETMASRAMLAKFGSGLYVGNRTMLCASSQMMTSKLAAKSGLRCIHAPNCA